MTKYDTNKTGLRSHTAMSPEEVFASGGPTAFAFRSGKNNETLKKVLNSSAEQGRFTEEEWTDPMDELARDK